MWMAAYLYRLGRWAFDNRKKVVLGWVAVLAVVIVSAGAFSGQFSEKCTADGIHIASCGGTWLAPRARLPGAPPGRAPPSPAPSGRLGESFSRLGRPGHR
jgi:hypothetical protein